MALERGKLTHKENIALAVAAVAVALLYIFGPSVYMAAAGIDADGHATMVPEHGTTEYQEYLAEFEAEHGRPWDVQDQMDATKNGALMIMQIILLEMSACMAFALVHDLRCWAYERRALPRDCMRAGTQAVRAAIYLVLLAAFLGGAFIMVPMGVVPVR